MLRPYIEEESAVAAKNSQRATAIAQAQLKQNLQDFLRPGGYHKDGVYFGE